MNLSEFRNNRKLIFIILIPTILILSLVSISFFKKTPTPGAQPKNSSIPLPSTGQLNKVIPPQVSPQALPQNIKQIRQKIIDSQIKNDNGDIILLQDPAYEIKYLPSPDIFFVTIFQSPAQNAKTQAQNWFLTFGLKQKDLCDLPVRFLVRDLKIRQQNPNFSSSPDGCTS